MNKQMKILFTGSVLINVIVIGVMLGCAVRHCPFGQGPMPPEMANLSPAGRDVLTKSFDDLRGSMDPLLKDAHDTRDSVVGILKADSFDPAAFAAASTKLRGDQIKIMEQRAQAASDVAAKLKQDDRQLMADWLAGPGRNLSMRKMPWDGKTGGDAADVKKTP